MWWSAAIFCPIIVVFYFALFVTHRISKRKDLTAYQAVLCFGVLNFVLLCAVALGTIVLLATLYTAGDLVATIFLFPIAGISTLVEMVVVFFLLRHDQGVRTGRNDRGAKVVLILLGCFVAYLGVSLIMGSM